MSKFVFRSRSEAETREAGRQIGARLQRGDLVALVGELGTGKTVLARGIAEGAGARGYIASPTFTLIREYVGDVTVYHVDLYRLAGREVAELGLEEIIEAGIAVIEWAEKAAEFVRPPVLRVEMAFGEGPDERLITVEAEGEGPQRAAAALRAASARAPSPS